MRNLTMFFCFSENIKVLIFNTTGDRDSIKLLEMLNELKFTKACFVPNIPFNENKNRENQENKNQDNTSIVCSKEQINRAKHHSIYWNEFNNNGHYYSCILDAVNDISVEFNNKIVEVLVTGSLHLIGAIVLACQMEKQIQK